MKIFCHFSCVPTRLACQVGISSDVLSCNTKRSNLACNAIGLGQARVGCCQWYLLMSIMTVNVWLSCLSFVSSLNLCSPSLKPSLLHASTEQPYPSTQRESGVQPRYQPWEQPRYKPCSGLYATWWVPAGTRASKALPFPPFLLPSQGIARWNELVFFFPFFTFLHSTFLTLTFLVTFCMLRSYFPLVRIAIVSFS